MPKIDFKHKTVTLKLQNFVDKYNTFSMDSSDFTMDCPGLIKPSFYRTGVNITEQDIVLSVKTVY